MEESNICKRRRISYFEDNDMFSKLPDDLLINVLSLLRTKEAVRTSILSKRWRHLYKNINSVDFKYADDRAEFQFHKFLMSLSQRNIKSFEVEVQHKRCSTVNKNLLDLWLTWAVEHGVEKLVLKINEQSNAIFYHLPPIVFQCKTLVELKLSNCYLNQCNNAPISWPLLKNLTLKKVSLSAVNFNVIIGNCISLDRLSLMSCQFRKSTQQQVKINLCSPTLKYLQLWDCSHSNNNININLPSLVDLSINMLLYRYGADQRAVLAAAATSVKSLTVGARCLKAFSKRSINGSTSATHVQMDLNLDDESYLRGMANLIDYCSNVQTLVINFKGEERNKIGYQWKSCCKVLDEKLWNNILHIKRIHVRGLSLDEILFLTNFSSLGYQITAYQKTQVIMSLMNVMNGLEELVVYLMPKADAWMSQRIDFNRYVTTYFLKCSRRISSSVRVSINWDQTVD